MRLLLLIVLVSSVLVSSEPCTVIVGDEDEYVCPVANATLTFTAMKNSYVTVRCDSPDFTCEDIDFTIDIGSNLPLKSLGLKHCPPSALRCMGEVVNASSFTRITLERMTSPILKEDVEKLGNVTDLIIRLADKQASLPLETITALPTLRSLRLNGARSVQLPSEGWVTAPHLTYLELSEDELSEMPPGGFRGLESLETLSVWGNSIERIQDGAFEGLSSLRTLSFSKNKLSSMSAGALSSLQQLRTLMITSNQLKELPDGILAPLTKLVEVEIMYNRVELTLGNNAFSNLPSLKIVKIYSNERIRNLPGDVFSGSTNIEKLQLNSNRIEELTSTVFRGLSAVVWVDLSRNRLYNLSDNVFLPLESLQYLNLNHNQITSLPKNLFAGLTSLKQVHIDYNKLFFIDSSALSGATQLATLSLAHNQLTLDQTATKYKLLEGEYSPFQALENLKYLNLTGNVISVFLDDFRFLLLQLEYLNLSYNNFTEIMFDQNPDASFMLNRATVDLRHNQISRVFVTSRPNIVSTQSTTSRLLLDDNPLVCDCHMYRLRLRTDGVVKTATEPIIDLGDARCTSPQNLYGASITHVSLRDFVCDLTLPNDNCTTIARPGTDELLLHCPVLPESLPDTSDKNVFEYFTKEPTITLKLDNQPQTLENLNFHTLNLSHINIETLQFKPTKYLKKLDLSYNNIKTLPIEFVKSNIDINLQNNSIDCNCWQTDLITSIKNSQYIHNAICTDGQSISNKDIATLCNTEKAAAVGITAFTIFALFVAVIIYLIYKYYYQILVWMINKEIFKGIVKEIVQDKDKIYDVFISYAHEDVSRIHNVLLPKLEQEFKQKVCVHYRDWEVGEFIPTQIQKSVEMSRRTIIFLSNSFLNSYWANLEFFTAHNLAQKEQRVRVILILLDESVLRNPKMPIELRAYIDNNTYMLWDDPKFFDRLQKVLPKKEYKINWPCSCNRKVANNLEIEEQKLKNVVLNVQLNNDGQLVNVARDEEKNALNKNYV